MENLAGLDIPTGKRTRKLQNKDRRRLSLFQHRGLFCKDTSGTIYTRATSADDLEKAYRLVHDTFVEKKYIFSKESGLRIRPFETSPNTATFVSKNENEVTGALSLVIDSEDLGLPSDDSFRHEINSLRGSGNLVCEVSNQAIAPSFRVGPVCTELMRCTWAYAWMSGCTHMICSISPSQKSFYNFIGFEQIGDKKSYSSTIDDPVVNMCWNLQNLKNRWEDVDIFDNTIDAFWKKFFLVENPYMPFIYMWSVAAEHTYTHNTNALTALFSRCKDLLVNSSPLQLKAIQRRLGYAYNILSSYPPPSILPSLVSIPPTSSMPAL